MKTGILIGTHNNAAHVADTIGSVRAQTVSDWVCIIMDNGSTDDTVARTQALIAGDERFRLHTKINEGPSAGRNAAYQQLSEQVEFIHFLDGDDKLKPVFLETLTSYLQQHPEVGLVGCQYETIDEQGRPVGPGHRSRYSPGAFGLPRQLRVDEAETPFETFFAATGQGPFAVFRASVFQRCSGYEVGFWSHEDSDIFCQMALLAPVHYLPDALYLKRKHAANLTSLHKSSYAEFRNKWDFYRADDQVKNRRIDQALVYYYGYHAPLRHFKVARLAGMDWLKLRTRRSFSWFMWCIRNGVLDLFFRRELRRRQRRRRELLATA